MPARPGQIDESPGVAGLPRLTSLLAGVVFILASPPAALGHGPAFDVVVEAVNRSGDPNELAYGIVLSFADGHEIAGAVVTVTAVAEDGQRVETAATMTTPGVHIADLRLDDGSWRVTVDVVFDDGEGSVEFSEVVEGTSMTQPVVRVDTADPDRQGETVAESAVFQAPAAPADGQIDDVEVRVEALVRDAVAPLVVEYGVVTGAPDGGASLSALSDSSVVVGPIALTEVAPGVFHGVIEYPEAGVWEVTLDIDDADGAVVTFAENLPWPHYTTEAGSPKIKVESVDRSLEGTLIEIRDSPIFALAGPVPTESAPASVPGDHEVVVVSIPSSGGEIGFQVMLRWLHLVGIGLWAMGMAAIGFGRPQRVWSGLAIGGMVATVGSGVALALWGAPIDFPGLLSWSELGERPYGDAYQWAFLVKMAFVLIAIVATSLLVAKSTRGRLAVAASGLLGALAAVVVMAQLHLFAHP